ncbi:MAG TPA: putative quinol monooxygenase [Nevskia sp.]|nr:putative quinol monooxygenase [Nevskia sp.]
MVGNLRIVRVRPGEEQRFEQLFGGLREELRRHEPGCLIYSLLRSRLHPGSYVIHEQYADPAALSQHQHSPAVAQYIERMRELQDRVEVEYFDPVCV